MFSIFCIVAYTLSICRFRSWIVPGDIALGAAAAGVAVKSTGLNRGCETLWTADGAAGETADGEAADGETTDGEETTDGKAGETTDDETGDGVTYAARAAASAVLSVNVVAGNVLFVHANALVNSSVVGNR